jgi:hypothetical protein
VNHSSNWGLDGLCRGSEPRPPEDHKVVFAGFINARDRLSLDWISGREQQEGDQPENPKHDVPSDGMPGLDDAEGDEIDPFDLSPMESPTRTYGCSWNRRHTQVTCRAFPVRLQRGEQR